MRHNKIYKILYILYKDILLIRKAHYFYIKCIPVPRDGDFPILRCKNGNKFDRLAFLNSLEVQDGSY